MRLSDKNLLLLSLSVSLMGLTLLSALLLLQKAEFVKITDLVDLEEGSEVVVQAKVASVTSTASMTHLTLTQNCSVDAVIFTDVNISEGDEVLLKGEIDDYGNSKNIIVKELKVIS